MAADAGRPSLLDGLKARREEILAALVEDVPVPGLPGVVLRVRPVGHDVISRQLARREKAKTPDARAEVDLAANAAIIAAAVAADGVVFGAGGDEEEVHTLKDVADVLLPDAEKVSGADTVRALFLRDGDVLVVGGKVMRQSGYADAEADESLQGE
jgi:hypothetical protein